MEKYLLMIFLSLTLNACSDRKYDEGVNPNLRSFFQKSIERILEIFKIGSVEESEQQHEGKQANLVQQPQKTVEIQKHLSQVMANLQIASQAPDQKIEKKDLAQYLQDYERAADLNDKKEALIALVQVDKKNAILLLKKAFASREPELRKEAVLQMRAFKHKKEILELFLAALDDPDPIVVVEAVEGLSGLESKRAIRGLKKIAKSYPDKIVREVAQDYLDQVLNK